MFCEGALIGDISGSLVVDPLSWKIGGWGGSSLITGLQAVSSVSVVVLPDSVVATSRKVEWNKLNYIKLNF